MSKIKIFQLSDNNVLKNIKIKYVDKGLKYGWKSTNGKKNDYGHWNNLILNCSKHEPFDHFLMPFINKHKEVYSLWNSLKSVIGERILLRSYINGYTYGTDAYAHLDDSWITDKFGSNTLSETVIIYLNQEWDIDWAGETVIYNDQRDIEASVLPKFGRVLIFDSGKLHAARPLSRICPSLRSVLVFKTADPKINSERIRFLLDHTRNIPHSEGTFFEHLFNTMLKLENINADHEVCKAGLFHSIYGTEFFNAGLYFDRKQIVDIIGEYSENLVHEFCSLKNRFDTIINNTNNYDDKFRKDLMLIERANLIDQNFKNIYSNQINKLTEEINK